MKVFEIQVEEGGNKMIVSGEDLPNQISELLAGEVGDTLFFTIAEMAEEDYKNLPEFIGW